MNNIHWCVKTRSAARIAIALGLILGAGGACGATVFGPKTYIATTGKRQVFDETFTFAAEACAVPAYTLVVTQGSSEVTSGRITVNGIEVVGDSNFNKNVPVITVALAPVTGINALHIEIGGKPGSSITAAVTRELDQRVGIPKRYTVTSGRLTLQDAILADSSGASFALVVRNGDEIGHRVSSGSLRISGVAIDLSSATVYIRKHIQLQATNSIAVDLRGEPGSFVTVEVMRVLEQCGPQITIDVPVAGAVITTGRIAVSGTLVAGAGAGVAINESAVADIDWVHTGTVADPYRWSASVAAEPGIVTLAAVATDSTSATAQITRQVTYAPAPSRVGLRATPSSGVAPLDAVFTVDSTVDASAVRYELDLDGDGIFEKSYGSFPPGDDLAAHYAVAGERTAALRVTTSAGQTYTATAVVNVQPLAVVDAVLQQQWSRFTSALALGDLDAAMALIASDVRTRYRPLLELIRNRLPAYAAGIVNIQPVWISADAAHYLMVRNQDGSSAGYHVYFVRDAGGVWRIEQF
jgi:hypothetical protein